MRASVVRTVSSGYRMIARAGMAWLVLATGAAAQPPSKAGGPPPLARYFPARDLVVYAEFEGLDAHRDAWKKTATYRVLTETTTGAMLEQTLARSLHQLFARDAKIPATARELVGLGEHLLRSGFAMGINRAGGVGPPRSFGVVIRGAATGPTRSILDRFLRAGEGPRNKVKQVEKPGGRSVHVLSDSPRMALAWWAEGDDLAISLISPAGVDAMLAALDGREPNAVDHATRTSLRRSDDAAGFEPVGLAFFDMAALPPLPREAVALGLDRAKRLDYRCGFHDRAIQSIVGVVVPAPRTGIPALFDQPAFDVRHLPPLPGGLSGFTVLSLDAAGSYDQVRAMLRAIDPSTAGPMAPFEGAVRQALGLNLRDEILAPMGSQWVLYTVPTRINAPASLLAGFAHALVFVPKSAIVLEVKDREAAARLLARLAERANQRVPIGNNPSLGLSATFGVAPLRPLKGPDTGYLIPPSSVSPPFPAGMQPTILLGRNELVLATSPATARRARDLHERVETGLPAGDPLAGALDQLPDRLMFLSVSDTRQSMLPDLIVGLPNLAEFLISRRRAGPLRFLGFPFGGPQTIDPTEPSATDAAPGGGKAKDAASVARFDPELVPEADAIRPFLFPSVSVLAVDDRGIRFISREAFPTINPATAVPAAIAMLVPAAHSSRIAAQRARSVNNLKQIGLAMHNFHSVNNHFPADVRDRDGKPLLSWRVQVLPFLEQQALFSEFKLDEPWDSPHNKALAERMPQVFAIPSSPAQPGMTFYRGFSGKGTVFDPAAPEGVDLARITDGTSNTIGVVEAKESVPWTRPGGEVPFDGDPQKPEALKALQEALGGHSSGGFNALFCDGSVRFIRDSINRLTLRALITRDGGEVISSDSF